MGRERQLGRLVTPQHLTCPAAFRDVVGYCAIMQGHTILAPDPSLFTPTLFSPNATHTGCGELSPCVELVALLHAIGPSTLPHQEAQALTVRMGCASRDV